MKAMERKRKREQERMKQNTLSDQSDMPKKKLISIPSQKELKAENNDNEDEINNNNKIQNIAASRPANNMDMEKISQRMRDRKERRKRQNMISNSEVNPPTYKSSNIVSNDSNNNNNIQSNKEIKDNKDNNNNLLNSNNNNNNNKLLSSAESVAPLPVFKKVGSNRQNNNIINNINDTPEKMSRPERINRNKKINANNRSPRNKNKNSNNDLNSVTKPKESITPLSASAKDYQFLSRNLVNIKKENIEEFLTKTNPNKPSEKEKELEVQRMIAVMNLEPYTKIENDKNNKYEDPSKTYAVHLTKKIEEDSKYYENQKEINRLKEMVKEEEKNMDQMLLRNKEEIQKYIEKIISLQNDLINSKQGDILALKEKNKIDEIQINNLAFTLQRLEDENEKERNKMNNLINKEIIPLQKELKNEINEVKRIKMELKQWNKKTPPIDIIKKIEVVMKYMKHCQ